MINVVEVKDKRMMKKFVEFPLKLYKDNPYYVPSFFGDEYKIFFAEKKIYSENTEKKIFIC